MKIKFIEGVTVPASRNEKELRFKDGSIHDLSEASAWRWVRRNKAVYYKVEVDVPTLKVGRPMMASPVGKPNKVGRPKKAKKDPDPAPQNLSPSLVKNDSRKGVIPGWNDV